MRKLFFILIIILPIILFGNMAKPWADGSEHSTLYGSENCDVIEEYINIELLNSERDILYAKYNIKYVINSDIKQTLPLLFLGIGLDQNENVKVNGDSLQILKYNSQNPSLVKFTENDSITIDKDHLIYFEAPLNKGENIVEVSYNANLRYNTFGFTKTYTLEYSLYPSQFWKTFGTIHLEIPLHNNINITSSNIGNPTIENNTAKWKIKKIDVENIELDISKKVNLFSQVLLFLEPFGIALISLFILFLFHFKLIRDFYKKKKTRYKSLILYGGSVVVSILFYVVYFGSFNLIDFSLGQQNSKHGYYFLFIIALPILILLYGSAMFAIDLILKKKMENSR